MAEIEFSVLSRSCLKQRLSGEEALRREVDALVKERNAAQATIHWRFNTRDARTKLHRLYPFDAKVDWLLVVANCRYLRKHCLLDVRREQSRRRFPRRVGNDRAILQGKS